METSTEQCLCKSIEGDVACFLCGDGTEVKEETLETMGVIDQEVVLDVNRRLKEVRNPLAILAEALRDWLAYDGAESLFEAHVQNVLDRQ